MSSDGHAPTEAERQEALKKQQEEAQQQIQQILAQSRPKHAGEGLTHGVSNIVGGAVGAVGIAVLAPTMGAAAGMSQAGVVGGILGLTGGAVVGVIGAAGLVVGGAVSGVSQIVRGVLNTPEAIMAPRQGKWWNELEGKWIKTNLPDDYEAVRKLPEDDKDLLGDVEAELDQSAAFTKEGDGSVKETYYYDVLEVGPQAEPSVIKRKYYVLAKKYHPDKVGADDKEAADRFKEVAEAYQVLSDPELRKKYNQEGRSGLSPDKTSAAEEMPKVDPTTLFAFLFGSDKFSDYIGRLATATSALVGDSPKVSVETARQIQHRRVVRLAHYLATKLDKWVEEDYDFCKTLWKTEAADLATASYGIQLVHLIGKVYHLSAIQFLGNVDAGIGMPSIGEWARNQRAKLDASSAKTSNKYATLKSGMTMMTLQQKYAQLLQEAKTEEEKNKIKADMETEMSTLLLQVLWTTTTVDITNTLYEVIQMVLFDQAVAKEVRERRAHGIKVLGTIFEECVAPEGSEEGDKDAKKLYEEAAFAAMLDTIQRKEAAQQKASRRHL